MLMSPDSSSALLPPPKLQLLAPAALQVQECTQSAPPPKDDSDLNIEFDGTTVLCRVCGDKASGFHYGVHSCEGCKGFFRRSIQQKIQYRPCTKNQQCSILRINRNRCQYCRLKKCIAVGMSRDAVRFGRVPKREKARILAAMQQSTQNRGQQRHLAVELDDQPRLLAQVLRAHMETCEFTRDKVNSMRQRARDCPSYSQPTMACPLNPAPEMQSELEFSQRFAHVIRGVIDFAGLIPGFQLLQQDDKFTLLKGGLFDALFVRLICMFDNEMDAILCLNGQIMRRGEIQNGANARFLVDSTFNFAQRVNDMRLSDAEIALFCALVLITPDRPGLRNLELVARMHQKLKLCLAHVIQESRGADSRAADDFLAQLLNTLPDLRTLSTLHTEKLVVFRTELQQQMWPEQMQNGGNASNGAAQDASPSPPHPSHPYPAPPKPCQRFLPTPAAASAAPLLAATLAGCPMRQNPGLAQNGLTITPVLRTGAATISTTEKLSAGATSAAAVTAANHQHYQNGATDKMENLLKKSGGGGLMPAGLNSAAAAGGCYRYRKLDSPTDSGIESGNENLQIIQNGGLKMAPAAAGAPPSCSSGSSSCSSPRSSLDDAEHHFQQNERPLLRPTHQKCSDIDMPVLKRVLQAPPLYDTNSLMDECYKPHKKFRALRAPPTTQAPPLSQLHMHLTRPASGATLSHTHSALARTLMEEPRMSAAQMRRQDIIQNYISRQPMAAAASKEAPLNLTVEKMVKVGEAN